ncbi:MAG: hypothetical protein GX492_11455 [Firmicutes bacterium]|nr:hypothetical protein [Bacillota bacterium]HHY33976.1 hypothetical protein [Bacillota bacterium]
MSAYHRKSKTGRTDRKEDATKTPISCEVAVSLEATRQRAKDGLPALCVEVGLNTLAICSGIMFQSRGVRFTR